MSRLQPAPGVAVVHDGGVVFVAPLPGGPIVVLEGGAAVIWDGACDGDRSSLPERVARATDTPVEDIRSDVEEFVAELLGRGLLVSNPA